MIEVAARMFHERGYDASSLQDIADELGILKGSLYHYIGSKDDLLWTIILRQHEAALALADRCRQLEGTPTERLTAFVKGYADSLKNDRVFVSIYLHEINRLSKERRKFIVSERQAYTQFVVDLLAAGQETGEFRADLDPELSANVMLGLLNSAYRWYKPASRISPTRVVGECLAMILHGVEAD
jgi:AcrR family transcriptional regulator